MTRLCALPGCDAPVVRRAGERPSDYRARATCCREHGRALQGYRLSGVVHSEPERRCASCGEVLVRHPGERPTMFRDRIGCSRRCAGKLRWVEASEKPARGAWANRGARA